MARKKADSTVEGKMESKITTIRVDYEINRRFRIICLLLKKEPKTIIEDLLSNWSEQNYKKISKEKLDQMVG